MIYIPLFLLLTSKNLLDAPFSWINKRTPQQFRARIVKIIDNHSSDLEDNKHRIKFLLSIKDDESEEVITYNQLLEYLSRDKANDIVWKFQRIVSHQGPLKP
jgi:hypothetical protein